MPLKLQSTQVQESPFVKKDKGALEWVSERVTDSEIEKTTNIKDRSIEKRRQLKKGQEFFSFRI